MRADDFVRPSEDLRSKIHAAMERAEFVTADISTLSPNVLYEVGYAAGKSRPLIVIADDRLHGDDIPLDLLSIELIYLGVAGLFKAFASFYGDNFAPELVSAAHASEALAEEDANLFLIGSGKVNRFTTAFLSVLQPAESPNWHFAPVQGEELLDDYVRELRGGVHGRSFSYVHEEKSVDWGIVVRGPHPRFPKRMVLIMAGAGSLGTGAGSIPIARRARMAQGAPAYMSRCVSSL